MLTRTILKTLAAVAAVVATGNAARADFIVDTFNLPNPVVYTPLGSTVGGAPGSYQGQLDALPGGITRSLFVEQIQNVSGLPGQTSFYVGQTGAGGAFSLSTATNTTAFASLTYTYTGTQNVSGAGSAVVFTGQADLNTPYSVTVTDSSGHSSTATGLVNASTQTSFSVPTSSFTGVDLANVKSIELVLNGTLVGGVVNTSGSTQSADILLTDVRFTTPNTPTVPAPPAAVLLLAAAPALGLTRFFRRKPAAA